MTQFPAELQWEWAHLDGQGHPITTNETTSVAFASEVFIGGESKITWPSPDDPANKSVAGTVTRVVVSLDAGDAFHPPTETGRVLALSMSD